MEKCLDLALRKGKAGGEPKPTENKHFCKAVVRLSSAGRRLNGQKRALGSHKRTNLGD